VSVENLSGRRLGRYELRERMGESTMSAVYHAYQTDLERHVAIKVLSPALVQDPGYIQRFTLEARTIASLEHPHIVPVYDYGVVDGISFVVMRLLTGGTLAQRLDQRLIDAGPLPSLRETANLIRQLASALNYAHSRGVIHRDVKSGNVMFDHQGMAYLVDFGIARLIYRSSSLTERGIVLGTPSHMAPEQWRDEPATPATDQYSLGVLTYLLVTGQLPFVASASHGYMYKHLHETPTPPHVLQANIPEAVAPVLERALAKQPEDRYPTVSAFADAFTEAVQGLPEEPTDFFTFSLSPATMPIMPISDEIRPQEREPTPQPPAAPPPIPPPVIDSTPPRMHETTRKPNYVVLLLVGASIGILLLAGVAAVGLFTLSSLINGNATSPSSVEQEIFPTSTFGVIPTLTPITITQLVLMPTPALTSIAQVNPTPRDVPTSIITLSNASQISQLASFLIEAVPVRSVAFSADGAMVASGNGDNTVRLWNVESGAVQMVLQGHSGIVYGVAFSSDGTLLASASGDQTIRLWNARSGELRQTLQGHLGEVRRVAFSPDSRLLASAGEDGTVRLWDTASGSQQAVLNGHTQRVLCVVFSADGTQLASAGRDGIILWDVATGNQRMNLNGHQDEVRAVAFSPDGSTLASASADNTIRLWNTGSGAERLVLRDHGSDVFSVDFSPDGSVLASGGRDNSVRLWDAETGQQLALLEGHGGWVFDVAFSPDGARIVSGGGDGSVRLWGL
jgi:WD40 repeat protein